MTELGVTHINTRIMSREGTVGKLLPLLELKVNYVYSSICNCLYNIVSRLSLFSVHYEDIPI